MHLNKQTCLIHLDPASMGPFVTPKSSMLNVYIFFVHHLLEVISLTARAQIQATCQLKHDHNQ
jgi:hypothetical protein